MSSDNVSRILSGCEAKVRKDKTELIHLHSHLFRRTMAMHLYQAGIPLPAISEWFGHSNIETNRFYAKVTEDMKRDVLHKLSDSDRSVFKDGITCFIALIVYRYLEKNRTKNTLLNRSLKLYRKWIL